MSPVYTPVCTCAVEGINGCAKHTYGRRLYPEPTETIARKIFDGQAFTDADAKQVADAYLFLLDDKAAP